MRIYAKDIVAESHADFIKRMNTTKVGRTKATAYLKQLGLKSKYIKEVFNALKTIWEESDIAETTQNLDPNSKEGDYTEENLDTLLNVWSTLWWNKSPDGRFESFKDMLDSLADEILSYYNDTEKPKITYESIGTFGRVLKDTRVAVNFYSETDAIKNITLKAGSFFFIHEVDVDEFGNKKYYVVRLVFNESKHTHWSDVKMSEADYNKLLSNAEFVSKEEYYAAQNGN